MQQADALTLRVLKTLNEAQARWYVARETLTRGRGGLKAMHDLTGLSRPTILKGIRELQQGTRLKSVERVRAAGGGRKRVEDADPGFERALERIMAENTAGDPMSLLRWTNKSTGRIAEELTQLGHPASDETVRRKLIDMEYSLQANRKSLEGTSPMERDEQFRYINRLVKQCLRRGDPVLSVDTKKKERVGNFKNPGRTWRPQGKPSAVNIYDFPHLGEGPAIPYGAYDVGRNQGFVNVGISHDTAEFAVEICAAGGASSDAGIMRRRPASCFAQMAGAATASGTAPGSITCNSWPTRWASRSRCLTIRPAPANGIRSSIGCSRTLV
jgi:hypothetical protein